ncbi:MAG: tetratricopeptide repeat protein [Prolixibacteraceae bacterium]|nr:tetratricopeptide repeat protein [Prolixibacteraceae bacterium]
MLLILGSVSACSVEKNTRLTRTYHNLTAHYNVYFNGKESLKRGVERINNSQEDDYTQILPIFKSSNPGTSQTATSEMEYAIEKASKLIKVHSITKNPKRRKNRTERYQRLAAREEYNKWIDDAYLLMGQAYYYMHNFNSAIENFSYVTRKFSGEETTYDAFIWLVRSYTMLERFVEASEIIQGLGSDEKFPKRLEGELALVTADYHIQQLEYQEAIPFLAIAAQKATSKKYKLRYKYILAQLYEETGNALLASETYREVARMNPPYKMAFNARINAAEAFTGEGNAEKLKKELRQMLRDRKNMEFRDQIYFALANITKNEGNTELAKDLYIKSAAASFMNMHQRALSCLTLADLYFDEPDYLKSKAYYDSAMVVIDEKYPGYNDITERHADLVRLVDNIYTVEKEDSLQRIAAMSESERNSLIDKWIREAKEAEEKLKSEQQDQTGNRGYYQMNQRGLGMGMQQQGTGWYFYTPATVAYGRVEFQQIWGNRKLEDGWRRSTKLSQTEIEAEKIAEQQKTDTIENVIRVIDPKERSFYTQDLPLNDSLMALSHSRIRDALYNAARIFKTVYSNYPRAISSYLDLNERYPESIYKLTSYFELWDLYTKAGDITNADLYKNRIILEYPESNYAKYLQNPDYFIEMEAQKDSLHNIYQQTFYQYRQGNYSEAGKLAGQMMRMNPDSAIIPKIEFFRIVAQGTVSGLHDFEKLLTAYISKYTKAETVPLAEKILTLIQDSTLADYQKLVAMGYLNDQIRNEELKEDNLAANDEFGGKFSYDEELLHYFVIAYPKDAGVDVNRLKFDIANYNIDHYTKIDFDIETETIGTNTEMLVVRALDNKENSLIYFRSVIRKREVFQALKDVKYVNFVVSSTNYREITADKNYNDYLKFFIKTYSRFITGDFSEELLPSPEELMAQAKAEEEKFEERGTFVMVSSGRSSRIFTVETDVPQNFVIAVNDAPLSLRQLMSEFSNFNRKNYRDKGLKISRQQIEGYQMVVVGPFTSKGEALEYFTKVVATRDLFASLGTRSYRNFLISDGNLARLTETGNLANYMIFFSDVYLKDISPGAAGNNITPEQAAQQNEKPVQAAGTKVTEMQNQPVVPAGPPYTGPFVTNMASGHLFVLIIPQTGVDKNALTAAVNRFNTNRFGTQNLKVSETAFHTARLMIKVEGFDDDNVALAYLKEIIGNQDIFGLLQDADYRNFIISEENLKIFLEKKDIASYMEFYKRFYLSRNQ